MFLNSVDVISFDFKVKSEREKNMFTSGRKKVQNVAAKKQSPEPGSSKPRLT